MHSPLCTVSLILLSIFVAVVLMADGSGCNIPSCGCMKRGVFDTAWLKANYLAVYEENKNNEFTYPNVTYPNCSRIVSWCAEPATLVLMSVDGSYRKARQNPFITTSLQCLGGFWYQEGLPYPIDSNLNSSRLSCATPI